jgi:multiple sugar transport system substrate-binding protein
LAPMSDGSGETHGLKRRDALRLAAGAGLAGAATFRTARKARAAETTLSIWTGFPELQPFYQAVADAYSKQRPGVKITIFATSLRECEQKLSAAVPTGTGPDMFDIGTNISVNFADVGLIDPNPAEIDAYMRSGAWNRQVVEFSTIEGKTYGLPFMEGSRSSMYYNKTFFKEAGIAGPPTTFAELIAAGQKLVKFDASGKMVRSGLSLRLSGQGSGVTEKYRYILEAVGASVIVKTPGGKYHNNFDNAAGRAALQFVIDVVQKHRIDDPKVQHDADAFVAGTTAMLFREAWVIGEIHDKNKTLDYGVAPIPRWTANSPYKMLLQPWNIYVNGKSSNKPESWEFLMFLTNKQNSLLLTSMTGWVSERADVDWKPLLDKTPQFSVYVDPPKGLEFYVEPVLTPWDEIQSRMADKLTAAFIDPTLEGNPAKLAEAVHGMAQQTDQLLKEADLYAPA